MKYQFCIRFENTTTNSAATKAVLDCNKIFLKHGYLDYTFTVWDNAKRGRYYWLLFKEILKFFTSLKKGSIVGIQYPLLSINNVFKIFIKIAKLKKIKFFCIVHDLESLRTGGKDRALIKKEVDNLNQYDVIIVHNEKMQEWLLSNGVLQHMVSLQLFDYLSQPELASERPLNNTVAYAGNLVKSRFVYALSQVKNWKFKLYGPNFQQHLYVEGDNYEYVGEYSPEKIVNKLEGNFGLIWDGNSITKCDEVLGNYLRYNNPHKFSLYIAAGLPVIAPRESAIADLIRLQKIGVLVDSLEDIEMVNLDEQEYTQMQLNVLKIRRDVISGFYFSNAIMQAERQLSA